MRLSLEKRRREEEERIIRIINGADSIGSSHHRCSVPNNNNINGADSIGSSAPSVLGP